MKSFNKYTRKFIFAGVALCMTMSTVFANTLSEVEINQNGTGYGIVLRTDAATQLKKSVASSNRMSVILKDVKVAEDLNTVYNNVSKMDNVTIQPSGKNDVKITFKGKGIADSSISFASSANVPAYPQAQSIRLNAPVSSYAPVYSPEHFVVEEVPSQTSNPKVNEVLTKMHITREMLVTAKKYTKSAVKKAKAMLGGFDMNMLSVFGILFIAAAFLLKPRRDVGKQRRNSIGLPARTSAMSNMDREIALNKQMASNMNLRPSIKGNYGVKAYQQSQRNPYMSANSSQASGISGISRRKPVPSLAEPKNMTKTFAQRPAENFKPVNKPASTAVLPKLPEVKNTVSKTMTSPISKPAVKKQPKIETVSEVQPEIDSMKFLESITKIYENSGRTDLAKGLKDNLRKAQLTKAV